MLINEHTVQTIEVMEVPVLERIKITTLPRCMFSIVLALYTVHCKDLTDYWK